ncbi:MAG: hypothetical protein AAFY34_06445 [Pseudomonadota bacterium]
MKKIALLTTAVAMLLTATPIASAEAEADTVTAQFAFDRDAPAAQTYRELTTLARRTCQMESGYALAFARVQAERQCSAEFIENAVAAIESSELSRYYTAQTGKTAGQVTVANKD